MILHALWLASCAPPCPEGEDRFDPGIGPENTDAEVGCTLVEEGDTAVLVLCNQDWCVEPYYGGYCVSGARLDAWRESQGAYRLDCSLPADGSCSPVCEPGG